jgi:hypothetical protein
MPLGLFDVIVVIRFPPCFAAASERFCDAEFRSFRNRGGSPGTTKH